MTSTRHWLALLLVSCLCLTAGCNSLFQPFDQSQSTTTQLEGQLAPGVTANGITDVSALTNAHSRILQEDSYTAIASTREQYQNGTLRYHTKRRAQQSPNGTKYYFQILYPDQQRSSFNSSINMQEYYSNNDTVYATEVRQNQTTYTTYNHSSNSVPKTFTDEEFIASFLTAFNQTDEISITELQTGTQSPRYRIRLTQIETPAPLNNYLVLDSVKSASFTAVIDGWGVIHRYNLTYTGQVNNQTVAGSRQARFTKIGQTHVPRPDWLHNFPKNQTTTTHLSEKA